MGDNLDISIMGPVLPRLPLSINNNRQGSYIVAYITP